MKRYLLFPLIILSLSGCAFNSVLINYPSQMAPVKAQINSANPMQSVSQLETEIDSADGLLYAQEAGRVAQIAGDFSASKKYYQQAIAAYTDFDRKATLSLSDAGATASSILVNDNVIPYRGPGYERIMLHQYQALNYLFSGDSEGALIEVRRSNELQASEQRRYEKSNAAVQAMENGAIDAEIDKLNQKAGSTTSAFLNAYSYYTTGLLYEILGQANDAFIDYRKAAQIAPNNPYLHKDLVRLAKQLHMPQYDEFKRRWGDAQLPSKHQGQVVVMLERGFVSEKQSITIPFRANGNWQTASLATYAPDTYRIPAGNIQGLGTVLKAAPIADIDALAVTALKEDLPAALARQAARAYAKSELARRVSSQTKRNNDQLDIGSIAIQLFNVVTEQADRRSWLTLPREAQIARKFIAPGNYSVKLNNTSPSQIEVKTGRTTLVWIIDTGIYTRFYTIII